MFMNERDQLEQAIAYIETQRATLGDAVVNVSIAALREKLVALGGPLATEQQRKQITVLFADVSGFTAMSETMDAEDLADTMNALWQRLDETIITNGGDIDKHIGDAVMALWGAGTSREDDPERAIYAALAVQAALTTFRGERSLQLAMRIGIHTGPVLLGEVASTHEFTAMGDTVNLASRLQHAAPVSGILISHETYRHVRGVFEVEPLEPISIKGKQEPVQVYLVLRAKPRAFHKGMRGVEGVETRMIGRDAELRRLQDAFSLVVEDGEFQMVTISGEAGVGKSRLLHEFSCWAEERSEDFCFLKGRARQEMQSLPYALLRDMFSFHFKIYDSDSLAIVWEKIEQDIGVTFGKEKEAQMRSHFIGQLLGFDFSNSPHIKDILEDARQVRDRALVYIDDYFKEIALRQPVLILLEDLHWADESSLDALNRLAKDVSKHPLLVVCTTRLGLFARRSHWGEGQTFHTRVELQPLSKRDSQRLVDEVLQKADNIPASLREIVVANAEGNPFYMEELIKMLIEDGIILTKERWQVELTRLKGVRVPPTLMSVLQARLDRLSPEEKATLQRASVVGRIFWDDAVAFLNDPKTAVLSETSTVLETLRDREMVFRRETTTFACAQEYIFKHALLRDATYESVLKRTRRVYHAYAAEWLSINSGDRVGEIAGLIAEHLEMSGQTEQAVDYLRQAGERALTASAFREALTFFEKALALLPAEVHARVSLTIQAGETLFYIGNFSEACQHLEEGLALARRYGDDTNCAVALIHLGRIAREQGKYEDARTRIEDGLALAHALNDQLRVAQALDQLGWVEAYTGSNAEAKARFAESLELHQALNNQQGMARALNGMGVAAGGLAEHEKAKTYLQESLALCQELGDRQNKAWALLNLGWVAENQEDYITAQHHYQEALDLHRQLGRREGIAMLLSELGRLAVKLDDYNTAVHYFSEWLGIAVDVFGATPGVLYTLTELAKVLIHIGQLEQALALLGLVQHHPTSSSKTQHIVDQVLADLRLQFSPDVVEAGLARGQGRKLEDIVVEIKKLFA